jgi:outer membrane immunogenic protein
MKRALLAGTAILVLAAAQASAADLRLKAPPKPPIAAPAYNWTGVYIGGHLGWGWETNNTTAISGGVSFPPGYQFPTVHQDGFLGGGQIGFNYQVAQWVLGAESDISWTGIQGSTTFPSPVDARFSIAQSQILWTSTLTGKLGYAWSNWLVYGKAGAAWAELQSSSMTFHSTTGILSSFDPAVNVSRFGWTAGAGIEYGLGNNWSVRAEYDYMDFGTARVTTTDNTNTVLVRDSATTLSEVKFGADYRLNVGGP